MRWGNTGNGSFGVSPAAYTLTSRSESASYYYYQEPPAQLTASSTFGAPLSHPHTRVAKKSIKRQGRRITGTNARFSKGKQELTFSSFAVEEKSPSSLDMEPQSTPLIMCAGKGVYGTTSDLSGSEDRDNNAAIQRNDSNIQHNNQSPPFTATKSTIMEQDSPPRHRTDEELEQIIRELRDQVFQKQSQDVGLEKHLESAVKYDKSAEINSHQKRQRRHLKNPIEKMEAVAATVPATISESSSGFLLQRPLSSSQLNQIMAENIQIAVPAVIYDAPAVTSKAGGGRVASNQISSLDFSSLRQKSRPHSSSTYRPREKQSLNPKQTSATSRTRRKGREFEHSSDCGDGFLYLVDVDSDDDLESVALSPVGPWVVDEFSTDTPRSPVSTCVSVSSLGSEDLDKNSGEWSNELTAKSPRSRLLYFSACADNSETSRCSIADFPYQPLRRSATSRSSLQVVTSTKLDSRATKLKRCSSATVSTRSKIRTCSSRDNPVKRPQSGGTRSSRSNQSR